MKEIVKAIIEAIRMTDNRRVALRNKMNFNVQSHIEEINYTADLNVAYEVSLMAEYRVTTTVATLKNIEMVKERMAKEMIRQWYKPIYDRLVTIMLDANDRYEKGATEDIKKLLTELDNVIGLRAISFSDDNH